jgi:formylglycine-generating enzyme required for sulfatase activity
MAETKPPKVFISYAWESDTRIWVRELATRLRSNGVHAILDQWDVAPGDSLPEFMEISVSASDFVLVVCTPAYKRKSDSSDPSGVGYEKGVITGELFVKRNQRKFIPILRKGKWLDSAPSWVLGKNYIDLRGTPYSEDNYQELLRTIYGKRIPPPPLGNPPDFLSNEGIEKDIGKIDREKAEREVAEKAAREKVEKESAEKVRLEAEENAKQKAAKEKAERETAEKAAREKVEKESAEKVRLEAEENAKQKAAKEKAERETAEKAAREKAEKEAAEKARLEAEENEKEIQLEFEKSIKKAKRDLRWENFKIDVRYRFKVVYIYRVPILILLVTFVIIVPLLIRLSNLIPQITSTFNNTTAPTATINSSLAPQQNLTSTETFIPTEILTPSKTPTKNFTPSSLPTKITDLKGVFMMLVTTSNGDNFYMDKYEVTNALYKECVDAGICLLPTVASRYALADYANHPVVYVNQNMANAYCEWRGARLPTEGEWELASPKIYGWLSCELGNYVKGFIKDTQSPNGVRNEYCIGDTVPVGSYEQGKSTYNIYDLKGNVEEWSQTKNVVQGGAWASPSLWIGTRTLIEAIPPLSSNTIGFRCAKDADIVTPIETMTPGISPTFTATLTNTPEAPASGFVLISINKVAYRGGTASAKIQAQSGTECTLTFILPSTKMSEAGGLGPCTADANGYCSWTWDISHNISTGNGFVTIIAGGESKTYPIKIE